MDDVSVIIIKNSRGCTRASKVTII